ncbi:hypothetical protein [Scytonema sp. HK-05]|uniref:hypothetical protein n=1 Tax=Scytonema sp. HK-05 TaxID=1137095 RepID=UPI000937BF06|nr:hypothetical protein [Scytonema sp. HK-05]OKH52375.1 hypothetical protein NIES2130_32065 [Scytonema sp. HK-05]
MTIQAPSAANQLALTLEQFIGKAEAFLQNHYVVGSDSADIQTILKAIADLRLDIDTERLEQEFELTQEKQDLMGDYYDSQPGSKKATWGTSLNFPKPHHLPIGF